MNTSRRDWLRGHRCLVLATAVVVLGAVFLLGAWLLTQPGSQANTSPTISINPDDVLNATAHGAVETKYHEDGVTIKERQIPYADGSRGIQSYRTDGTLRKTVEHYPLSAPTDKPVVKAEANWSEDGRVMVQGKIYRQDGSLWLTFSGGNDNKSPIVETFYFPTGWRFKETVSDPANRNQVEVSYFRSSGKPWAKARVVPQSYGRQEVLWMEVFDPVNGNLQYRLDRLKSGESAGDFTAPDSQDDYSYGYYYGSNEKGYLFTVCDPAGRPQFRQWYGTNYFYHGHGIDRKLELVQLIDARNGKVTHSYQVSDEGFTVKPSECIQADGTIHTFWQYSTSATRKHLLQEFDYYGQKRTRSLEVPEPRWIEKPGRAREASSDTSVLDNIIPEHFAIPSQQTELDTLDMKARAEDMSGLGHRDDSDPVKWYRRPR